MVRKPKWIPTHPVDETFDAKAKFAANKIEMVLGSRIGRLRNSSLTRKNEMRIRDTAECDFWCDVPSRSQTKSKEGTKDVKHLEGGSNLPVSAEDQGVGTVNPGVRGSKLRSRTKSPVNRPARN